MQSHVHKLSPLAGSGVVHSNINWCIQVVSEAHRRALKLSPESFNCSFRLEDTTILAEIERWAKPSPGTGVTAHLSALNVYGPGDHFTQHKDSPPFGGRSFGTLVIGLPSRYTGNLAACSAASQPE